MMAHNTVMGMTAAGTREEGTEAMGAAEAMADTAEVPGRDREVALERETGTGTATAGLEPAMVALEREMEALEPVHLEEAMGQELVLLSELSQVIQANLIQLTLSVFL
jgi:hypothetical protein